jgi:uncharacterized protein (TIGR03790 family)
VPRLVLLICALLAQPVWAEGLSPDRLGVIFKQNDPASVRLAQYYARRRGVPPANVVGLPVPDRPAIDRTELQTLRGMLLEKLPSNVQSLLLIWSRPYAVECMSITTAIAAGYQPSFCEPGCARTQPSPLYDSEGWLPADTTGWLPAMLLPTQDEALARAVIDRGVRADGSRPPGTVYLVSTGDPQRNVRSAGYGDAKAVVRDRVTLREVTAPGTGAPAAGSSAAGSRADIVAYFTGALRVIELPILTFRPGAAADHLTSLGGVLDGSAQMSAVEWLQRGATASYGTVSEPCNLVGKFPSPSIFLDHYLRGETLLEAYWKSVAMPGQGLFIGEPLARPYPPRP